MSETEGGVPLRSGRKVLVWRSMIERASEHLARTNADYVTFVVAGEWPTTAVELLSETPARPAAPVAAPVVDQAPRKEAPRKAGRMAPKKARAVPKGRGKKGRIEVEPSDVLQILASDPKSAFSSRDIGDRLNLARDDINKRAYLSRLLRELRLSGMIKATSNERLPDYIFVDRLAPSNGTEVSETSVLRALTKAGRPLPLAVIGDLLNVPRADFSKRMGITAMLNVMVRQRKLRRKTEEKVGLYSAA